ncbi:helix-turn-helix domain-containing protein [Streptomyces sp. NPDC000987]|uniref:winged helix-turn-helix transcriptional regulator n=1 Tax=Streptomyces sp. NPDC000987 TaxID=3154374 RepID=UPI003322F88E
MQVRRTCAEARLEIGPEMASRVRDVLARVGDKWSIAVVNELGAGPRRFSELQRSIAGISQRMLTVTLRGLERDGLLTRTVHPVVPPRVDYELTPLGLTLLDKVWGLMAWALEHAEDITAAQLSYDQT